MKIATFTNRTHIVVNTSPPGVAPGAARVTGKTVALGHLFPLKLPGGLEIKASGVITPAPTAARPGFTPINPILRGNFSPGVFPAYYVSPLLAAQRSANPLVAEDVQKFTSLIATNCGTGVKLAHDAAWLGHDFIVFYRDLKDPAVSKTERLLTLGELGSGLCGVLAGIFNQPWLDRASTTLHFTAMIGDHLHTGRLTFSQSELLELSAAPDAEEYSKIVALSEIALPPP